MTLLECMGEPMIRIRHVFAILAMPIAMIMTTLGVVWFTPFLVIASLINPEKGERLANRVYEMAGLE